MKRNHGSPSSSRRKKKTETVKPASSRLTKKKTETTVKAALLDSDEKAKRKHPVTVVGDNPVVDQELKPLVLIVDHDRLAKLELEFSFLVNDCNGFKQRRMDHNHESPSSSRLKKKTKIAVMFTLLDSDGEKSKSKPKQPELVTVIDDIPVVEEPKPHVLIVDYDPRARFELELSFLDNDCNVTTAGTCEEALRLLRIDHDGVINSGNQETIPPVDLIIVDYFMAGVPGMTGYVMLSILKKSPMKEIQVMILTSQPGPLRNAQYYKCKQDGADFVVTKPLSLTRVQILKSGMLKKMGSMRYEKGDQKNISITSSDDMMDSNYMMALAIANDPDAFDNHFHGEEPQQMQNQFYDGNHLEDQYTYFEDYLLPFLV